MDVLGGHQCFMNMSWFYFQTDVQVFQLAHLFTWNDRLYYDVFPYQPYLYLCGNHHHVIIDYTASLPISTLTMGLYKSGLDIPSSEKIPADVGHTERSCQVLASADSVDGLSTPTVLRTDWLHQRYKERWTVHSWSCETGPSKWVCRERSFTRWISEVDATGGQAEY